MNRQKQKLVDQGRGAGGFSLARLSVFGLRSTSRGFSLIELMAVMFIILVLMGVATVGLRGVMRGSGFSGAVSVTRAAFSQARQHAMMQGRPTAVILEQDGDSPGTLRVVASYGRVGDLEGDVIVAEDELPWNSGSLVGATIYNFSGDSAKIARDSSIADSHVRFGVERTGVFSQDDEIGFEVGNLRRLPSGFVFSGLGTGGRLVFEFSPDGTVSGAESFGIGEVGRTEQTTISVDSGNGRIRL